MISYTPLRLPPSNPNAHRNETASFNPTAPPIILPRRDLFDVRFQLLNDNDMDEMEEEGEAPRGIEFVDAPSDLVPGVYEGGLKTWECSVDLAAYLAHVVRPNVIGGRFLEVSTSLRLEV